MRQMTSFLRPWTSTAVGIRRLIVDELGRPMTFLLVIFRTSNFERCRASIDGQMTLFVRPWTCGRLGLKQDDIRTSMILDLSNRLNYHSIEIEARF